MFVYGYTEEDNFSEKDMTTKKSNRATICIDIEAGGLHGGIGVLVKAPGRPARLKQFAEPASPVRIPGVLASHDPFQFGVPHLLNLRP